MASTKPSAQVTFSTNASVTINSAAVVWSDPVVLDAEDWEGEVQVNADNQGTPASGDVCNVYIAYTTGDVLGDSGADYATPEHAELLFPLDTYATNTPGEDPAGRVAPIRTGPTGFKLGFSCPNAAARNIVVRAMVVTHRGQ